MVTLGEMGMEGGRHRQEMSAGENGGKDAPFCPSTGEGADLLKNPEEAEKEEPFELWDAAC